MDKRTVDKIIKKYNSDSREVLEMLLDIQKEERYLPRKALEHLAEKLNLPMAKLYRIATFYEGLSLKPLGGCQIHVCTGTACHVRGASKILDEFEHQLGIKPGEVTPDLNFSLKTVNCVGACALGPVVTVNDEHCGNMSTLKIDKIIRQNKEKKKKQA